MGSVQNTKFRLRLLSVEKTRQGSVKLELCFGGGQVLDLYCCNVSENLRFFKPSMSLLKPKSIV